ncbi:MAG: sodium:solute symporter, partial [Clostridia bacterium]|nr:sodium:solute symporter [Clostridia bacterium]
GQGGFLNAMKELSIIDASDVAKPALQGAEGLLTSFFGPDPAALLGVVILTSLGTWGLPQMVQKFYAIKDEKSVQTGTVISTFFAFVVAGGCYFLGGFGRLFGDVPGVHNPDGSIAFDAIIPSMLSTLPDILIGIVIVLVLSASMSTLSSLVLTSSSTMTLDFLKKTWWQDMSEKTQLVVMRVLIAVFIVISVALAFNPPAFIAQMMGVSWGGLAGAFLAPFMYGLYSKNVTKLSVWVSFAWGVLFTVMNMFFHYIASPINAGAITMIIGLILVPLVSYVTPKMDKDEMEDLFAVYDEEVVVHKSHSLQEGTIKAVRAVKAKED